MKTKLVPLYFEPGRDPGFDQQLGNLKVLLAEEVEFLPAIPLGAPLPDGADAVVFPQFLGEGYRCVPQFQAIKLPLLVITSEFGTLSMWDWELICYLRENGVQPHRAVQHRPNPQGHCGPARQTRVDAEQVSRLPG